MRATISILSALSLSPADVLAARPPFAERRGLRRRAPAGLPSAPEERALQYETSLSMPYEDPAPPPRADEWPLAGTAWRAVEIDSVGFGDGPPAPVTLSFKDGGVSGSAGCNRYFGGVEAPSSDSFRTGALFATEMYCEGLMEQEDRYMRLVRGRTFFYEVDGAELVLFSAGPDGEPVRGDAVARFVRDDFDQK